MNSEVIDIQTRNLDGDQATMLIVKNDNTYEVTLTYRDDTKCHQSSELEPCYLWAEAEVRTYGYVVEYE